MSVQESIARYANKKRFKIKQRILQSMIGYTDALKNFETQIFE